MAELVGLSLAANIAQFVVLGFKTGQYLKNAYNQTGDFLAEKDDINAVVRNVQNSVKAVVVSPDASIDADLKELAKDAGEIGRKLEAQLQAFEHFASKKDFAARIRLVMFEFRHQSEMKQLTARLVRLRDQITSQLVLCSYQARASFVSELQSQGAKLASIHSESSKRLQDLYDRLISFQQQMQNEESTLNTLETMATDAHKAARHCILRTRIESVLRSLRFDDISSRRSNIPQAHKNTFKWAFSEQKANLSTWLQKGQGTYWISGKAGSGKSTLMKYIQAARQSDRLLQIWAKDRPLLVLSHYFWAPGTELQRSMTGLFRTLLFQIFLKDPELLEITCPSRLDQAGYQHVESWTFEELKGCFESLLAMKSLPSKLCIFIDGLDEFEGPKSDLLKVLQSASRSQDIKLCVSSRPWIEFRDAFGNMPDQLCVEHFTQDDISQYVQDNLQDSLQYQQLRQRSPEEAELLSEELSHAASGVFLWVFLATRDILRGLSNYDDISTLRRRLVDIPRDLEDYFERMLHNIDRVYHYESSALFKILSYTRSPLTTLITWAFRESTVTMPEVSEDSRQFYRNPASDDANNSSEILQPRLLRKDTPLLQTPAVEPKYDMMREKTVISARCRDLLHVGDEKTALRVGIEFFNVDFLHRTVAEFLALPRIKAILDRRLEESQMEPFYPPAALAHSHLQLLRHIERFPSSDSLMKFDVFVGLILQIIYHAKQTTVYSVLARQKVLFILFNLVWDLPTVTGSKVLNTLGNETYFNRYVGLLAQDTFKKAIVADHDHFHRNSDKHLDSPMNKLFWIVSCRDCLLEIGHPDMLKFMLGIVAGDGLEVTMDSVNKVGHAHVRSVDLDLAEAIIKRMASGQVEGLDVAAGWVYLMNVICALRNQTGLLPNNLLSLCQLMIRHGAPLEIERHQVQGIRPDKYGVGEPPRVQFLGAQFPNLDETLNTAELLKFCGLPGLEVEFQQAADARAQADKSSKTWWQFWFGS